MFDQQTMPLQAARKVLRPETMYEVRSLGYSGEAYSILDRWATNQPEDLRQLEAQGMIPLMLALSSQTRLEAQALNSPSAQQAREQGMCSMDILQSCGIDMSLRISA